MKQILVYSDSLTWGIIPGTRNRLPFDRRWPGVMELALQANGVDMSGTTLDEAKADTIQLH